jgi:hypothetical protein
VPEAHEHRQAPFHIKIDRTGYKVTAEELTGEQLRQLPHPPIGPDRDLFEIIPGQPDRKIANDVVVEIYDGKRLFTAPAHINPGSRPAASKWATDGTA